MPTDTTTSELLDRYVAASERGNYTSVEIAAAPEVVWEALLRTTLRECRITGAMLTLRGLPARLTRRGALFRRAGTPSTAGATSNDGATANAGATGRAEVTLVDSMTDGRFVVLELKPGEEFVLGLVGQFWKLSGGSDVPIADTDAFVAFEEPGYVKTAVNFRVDATATGSRLSTETRCVSTDRATARKFGRYWLLIGWGSKLIRRDILAAIRRRAESTVAS